MMNEPPVFADSILENRRLTMSRPHAPHSDRFESVEKQAIVDFRNRLR